MTDADRRDPTRIYETFEEVLNISKTNFRATRLDYFYLRQLPDESLDNFYIRCKDKAKSCQFTAEVEKEMFLILVLANTPLPDFHKWLMDQPQDVTIARVLQEGRKCEAWVLNVKRIAERESGAMAKIKKVHQTNV